MYTKNANANVFRPSQPNNISLIFSVQWDAEASRWFRTYPQRPMVQSKEFTGKKKAPLVSSKRFER